MIKFKANLLKLFLCVIFNFTIITPQSQIRFNNLSTQDGLSSTAVTCIFQDSKGFMWFGTQDGLNRYDGYKLKVFNNNPNNPRSLSENFIFSIYEDKDFNLYFETISGKIHKYNSIDEAFIVVPRDSINLYETRMSSVLAKLHDENNIIWSGGLSKPIGLTKENIKTGETKTYKYNENDKYSISDDRVYSIYRDNKGTLWIATYNGLNRFDEESERFYRYYNDPDNPLSLSGNFVWPIFQDSHGNLWIGTVNGGLNLFNYETESFYRYQTDESISTSISDNFIFSIYEDRGGVIWIGTNNGGVSYFHPSLQVFEHYLNIPSNKNSLSDNDVSAITVDQEGNYWIGTSKGGLNKFNYKKNKFEHFVNNPKNSNSLVDNYVHVILEDKSGIIWIGSFNSGLDAYNPRTGKFTHYKHNPSDPNSISDNGIYSMIEDNSGEIWIGTNSGGINRFDKRTKKFKSYRFNESDSLSLSSDKAWSIIEDNSGQIWVGTFGGGVNLFNKENETFTHFKNNPNDSLSISSNNVIRIFEDSQGRLWFGTTTGLNKFLPENGKFKVYRESDGLANDLVLGIEEDDNGFLWISTNNGLSYFNPETETFKNYYYSDGLQSNEFNQNASAKDSRTGRLLFGGPNGINIFHPDSIKENKYLPPIVFTDYLRYNTDDEEGKPIVEKGISERDEINLTYKDNIINLDFSALSYMNNHMNQYKYQLVGFNENWIQLGNNHSVTFTNLSPGDYILKIIGSNNDGYWNEEGTSLSVIVTPPWWKTNIAYTFYGLFIFFILYVSRKMEINRREQKAKMRETELRAKAAEAEKRVLEVENERKTKELEEARQLQLSMLPKEIPIFEHLEIAAYMRTATEVGGDYYDVLEGEDGTLNIAFGDATGHGLQAGTMVTLMKGFFTSYGSNSDIKSFFERSTKTIKEIKLGRILMAFSFLKIKEFNMIMSGVGMPPAYYFSQSTNTFEELVTRGMPLGARAKIKSLDIIEKELIPGDTIMLFSDGVPEQLNEENVMYDYPKLQAKFLEITHHEPDKIVELIVQSVDEWRGEAVQEDDVSLMVIRVK